jgi:predicted GIY-YIG superfamily endonuclease
MSYFVYILASRYKGTLYVGATRDLAKRVGEHKGGFVPGFTKAYKVHVLVYYEEYASVLEARARERVLNEAMATRVEDKVDRRRESSLAGSDTRLDQLVREPGSRVSSASFHAALRPGHMEC